METLMRVLCRYKVRVFQFRILTTASLTHDHSPSVNSNYATTHVLEYLVVTFLGTLGYRAVR